MKKNALKQAWAEGRPALNAWLSVGNGFTAEIVAAQGFDTLTIDIQHGIIDFRDAVTMLQATRAASVT